MKGLVLEPINMAGKGPLTTSLFSPPESPSGKFRAQRSVLVPQFHKKTFFTFNCTQNRHQKIQQHNGKDWGNLTREPCFFPQVSGL